ncbi:MAG: cation-translocating P-type ATPase [Bacillaceae bacterium]
MRYKQSVDDVLHALQTTKKGLSKEEAQKRLKEDGYNELKEKDQTPTWKLFLETFKDPLVVILLIAATVQVFLGEVIESVIILLVLILNAILSVTQTKKAESSLESLKQLSAPNAKVERDGVKITIPAREIVKGDIVHLEAGDSISVDGRLIEAQTLKVVEGMLTGESEPVLKQVDVIEEDVPLGDRKNMVFSGALVVYGRGTLVATETGMNTEVGKIAGLLETAQSKQTPLQRKLDDFSKKLGMGIIILSLLIFAIQVFRGWGDIAMKDLIADSFMFSVAVAVAAIPEALSSIVTIVLAVGTNIMAKKQAIIRKLPAVETLGSTSVICTDKTGTLTQNKMTVVDFYMYGVESKDLKSDREEHQKALFAVSALSNDALVGEDGKEIGDPTEVALVHFANKYNYNYDNVREKFSRLNELPFDSDRKIMSTVNDIDGDAIMFTKGAPDVIFSRCTLALNNGEVVPISDEILAKYRAVNEEFSNRALRVLALAVKDVPDTGFVPALEDEVDMILVGLVAMIDPPREEVVHAVKEARSAGIRSIMITGDHKTTAAAIGREIGLMEEGDLALTGQELDAMNDEEHKEKLERISVYARVSPENKIRIVKAWQDKGCVSAMTGDGVNDAPALKQADIGIAMGSGTDVAKDASAMILVDDNFASIVNAIEVGRTVYDNIKKSITYLFAGNLGAIIAILFAVFAGWANPFTALQLLFINLINDSLPAIALGLEPSEKNIMKMPPRDPDEGILAGGTWQAVLSRGLIIGVVVIIAQYVGMQTSPETGAAMAFSTVIMARILQTFAARSNKQLIFKLGLFTNKYVLGAVGICFVLYFLTLIPFLRPIFAIPVAFGLSEFGISFGLAAVSLICMEIQKLIFKTK